MIIVIVKSNEIKVPEIINNLFRKMSLLVKLIKIFIAIMIRPAAGARRSSRVGASCSAPTGRP